MKSFIFYVFFLFSAVVSDISAQYLCVPEEVGGLAKPVVSLNGTWKFDPVFRKDLIAGKTGDTAWKEIRVPGEWVMQGYQVKAGEAAAYARDFSVPAAWEGRKVMLRCDAVFSKAEVWVNGHFIGSHMGGMTPFELDLTSYVRPGKNNRLLLAVTAETMADTLMSGSQYAAHSLGGILRKIYLYALPQVYAGDMSVTAEPGDDFRSALLVVDAKYYGVSRRREWAEVAFRLFDPAGKEVSLPAYDGRIVFGKGGQVVRKVFHFPLEDVASWDPEHPRLYRLVMKVTSPGGEETLMRKIGFRRIEVVGNRLFINGMPVKMRGVNRHETHPLLGRSLNNTLWHLDAEIFKEGNVNYIRTSHYPPAEEFVAWCDSLGLLVELETPFCWVGHGANAAWKKADPQAPSLYDFLEHTAAEVIAFYRDHPSVTIWSMANESAWGPNWEKLLRFYQTTDSTRPVSFHDQAYGGYNNYGSGDMPIAVFHYPGPAGGRVADTFSRPLLFGEYCHINCYNRQEIAADPGVRDAWGRGFLPMWNSVWESAGGLGGAIWAGIDDVFYLPEGRAVGYGEWGVIDGWRRKKPEYYHMKKTYAPVRVVNKTAELPRPGEAVRLEVENRFDFTGLGECDIVWSVNGTRGKTTMMLPPHSAGILHIGPAVNIKRGDRMTLTFISPQGRQVDRTVVTFGDREGPSLPAPETAGSGIHLEIHEGYYLVSGDGVFWKIDRRDGRIVAAGTGNDTLLTAGPELMMLPLKTGPCVTDYKLDIPPLNDLCHDRKAGSIIAHKKGDTVVITMKVRWKEAHGRMEYIFLEGGGLTVRYDLVSDMKIDPRQWGMVFSVKREIDRLEWDRRGLWTVYPQDHIGRTHGRAVPFLTGKYEKSPFGKKPDHAWCYDANALGSNDFRSSKEKIWWAALTREGEGGVLVDGEGSHAFRAWVDGEHISFLVAGFSSGGGDLFFSAHYREERRPLKRGDPFSSVARIRLLRDSDWNR